jgi:hypothetical protein
MNNYNLVLHHYQSKFIRNLIVEIENFERNIKDGELKNIEKANLTLLLMKMIKTKDRYKISSGIAYESPQEISQYVYTILT